MRNVDALDGGNVKALREGVIEARVRLDALTRTPGDGICPK